MKVHKVIKITTPKQFASLVELLEKTPELAKSYHNSLHKVNIKEEWNKIANKLNSLGPPFRTGAEWMKVWADYKCNLKKKIIHNKAEYRSTGGGSNKQYILSPTEEAASNLLQLSTIVNPEGEVFGLQKNSSKEPEYIADVDMNENEENIAPSTPQISRKRTSRKYSEKIDLIEQQLQVQTNLYNEVKESLKQIERYSRKNHKIKEEKLKLYKSELKRKEERFKLYKSELTKKDEHRKLIVKLRQAEIDIKTRQIELEEWKHSFKK